MTDTVQIGKRLDLYISAPQTCDYLADKQSQSIFISPDVTVTPKIYEYLISIGFRRSGKHAYRPQCSGCQSCISSRIDVQHFKASRSQKRLLLKNNDLTFKPTEALFSDEHYDLYLKYQAHKHPGGSMEQFGVNEYEMFICQSFGNSILYETRLGNKLLAVSVTDIFDNALSAVYTFFEPAFATRSLGTYSILQQIQGTKIQKKQHLYLGYFIKDSLKMSYKANFRPIEMLIKGEWKSYLKDEELPNASD
ncbi:MAG: arginyltransferase [Piscirickettsiaceae bacterium]|nr:MAG: arginyltransferase [Piscirickettsiaceae bacterium]